MPSQHRMTQPSKQLQFDWPMTVRDSTIAGTQPAASAPLPGHPCVSADPSDNTPEKCRNDELIPIPDGPERQALLAKCAEYAGTEAAEELDGFCQLASFEAIASANRDHAATTSTTMPDSHGSVTTAQWDFRNSFPKPNRAIAREHRESDNFDWDAVKSLHERFSQELSAILGAIDVIHDAKARKVDPRTGKRPADPKEKKALERFFEDEPAGLQYVFNVRMDEYAALFGPRAASAFRIFLRNITPRK